MWLIITDQMPNYIALIKVYSVLVYKFSTVRTIVLPDSLPPSPSTYAFMKTPDPQPPNLSPSQRETEQTPKRQKGDHDGTEPVAVGDILMEYCPDYIHDTLEVHGNINFHKKKYLNST